MGSRRFVWLPRVLGSGLLMGSLLATGCDDSGGGDSSSGGKRPVGSNHTGLLRAKNCDDLLAKIQADAIAKVHLAAEAAKTQSREVIGGGWDAGSVGAPPPRGADDWGGEFGNGAPAPTAPGSGQGDNNAGGGANGGGGTSNSPGSGGAEDPSSGPTGASDTNNQVAGVDEADFVKVVDNGSAMFVLHGSTLHKLDTWPAEETSLASASLKIEGSPSEMFITAGGKAVIFSTVSGYGNGSGGGRSTEGIACAPVFDGFGGCYGGGFTKITIADVSGDTFKTERELYYEGHYVSSRRYGSDDSDVVRVVLQAAKDFSWLNRPDIKWYDPNNQPYDEDEIARRLARWAEDQELDIRRLPLGYWLPLVQEAKDGKLVDVPPACDSYFVPPAGSSDYGLTHVLSIDVAKGDAPVGGVTVMGGAQTVYSNLENLVLAQPDYRWSIGFGRGLGFDEQRTALHMFAIKGADTTYEASGWVPGQLPLHNPQFGIDVKAGVVRVATTENVPANPEAKPDEPGFWERATRNRVFTLKRKDDALEVVGKSEPFGKPLEQVQSARFIGDRAYVVTFLRIDPLVVLDVADPEEITILGEIEIPGFSQYMHPLDDTHLITLGESGTRGVQLQLYDVTDPTKLPAPKVLDFGDGNSEGQYNHKAFTFFREQGLLAIPLYSYGSARFGSTLRLVRVDKDTGFEDLGSVDHSPLFQNQEKPCVQCYEWGCEYYCSYSPEVRRGHFVSGEDATYVYSFSYAGVLVNDVDDLSAPLASVLFPSPAIDYSTWYGGRGGSGGSVGGGSVGVDPIPPSPGVAPDAGSPPDPGVYPVDAGPADAGSGVWEGDGGVAIEG